MTWLGRIPAIAHERHYGDRIAPCFSPRPRSLNAMLAEALARNPGGEALVSGATRLDYAALDVAVARFAGHLAGLGVAAGDRVALLLPNSAEFVLVLLAAMRIGAIAVPLNVREGPRELAFVLADCGASVVVHDAALRPSLPSAGETPDLVHRLPIELAADGTCRPAALPAGTPAPPADLAEEAVAAILYTSGTTGRPKGAMLTHLGLVHAAMIYEGCMGLDARDRSLVSVPLSHVTGLTAGIAAMLRAAGALVVMRTFQADAFVALAEAERMTHTVMVPAMYNLCLLSPGLAGRDLSRWRIGGYGGAPMPAATIARLAGRLPGLALVNVYGSTETTGPVVMMPPAEGRARASAVGRAVPTAAVLVMDEAGREVAAGESGEIWLRAPNIVPGYWGNAAATTEAFVGGYWRSGDIGTLDRQGYLTLLDRVKDLVNRGGYKVYSVEVENVLASHPAVIEAAVVARPCPVLGERVHAFVVLAEADRDLAPAALSAHCAARLADYKVPETFTPLATALPRNAAGKVLKRDLRRLAAEPSP